MLLLLLSPVRAGPGWGEELHRQVQSQDVDNNPIKDFDSFFCPKLQESPAFADRMTSPVQAVGAVEPPVPDSLSFYYRI